MTQKRKLIATGIQVGPPSGFSMYDLREAFRTDPVGTYKKVETLVEAGKIRLGDIRDLKAMYQMFGDVEMPITVDVMGAKRSIMSSAFPILTGLTVIKEINDAYQLVQTIGELLVTEMDDNKKVTEIAAVWDLDKKIDEVKEGDDFPEISASEEMVQIRHKRNGRILKITQEMIEENDIAGIVDRVNTLANIAATWVEEQTLDRVFDKTGSNTSSAAAPYVYLPNGSGTALYSSTANTPGTRAPSGTRVTNNALADITDLDAARAVLVAMKDNNGKRIAIPRSEIQVVVPDALLGTLFKILGSEYVPGVENQVNPWGPKGPFYIAPQNVVSSPKIDDISTTAWYMGAFRRQFKRKWKLRFEYVVLGNNTESFLRSRVAAQYRIAWDCEIGAIDYVNVVQNLSGTTYTP